MPISTFTGVIANQTTLLINARELHQRLQVKTLFKDWIKRRIEEYGFIDGEDFSSDLSKSAFGRPSIDYHITVDMAKELCMLERSELGR